LHRPVGSRSRQSRPPAAILSEPACSWTRESRRSRSWDRRSTATSNREPDGRITRLADLLWSIGTLPSIERIKFITSFPNDMTDDLLQAVRDLSVASRYIHVPAQSGCDEILRR